MNRIVRNDPLARCEWMMDGDHGDRCAVTWRPITKEIFGGFNVHHLIHGAHGRSDEPANFLLLSYHVHMHYHHGGGLDPVTKVRMPPLTLENMLWCKSESGEWNLERLTELFDRRLPEPYPLPEWFLRERELWQTRRSPARQ